MTTSCAARTASSSINGVEVDESDFLFQGDKPADNYSFDVVVPADHIFVLGDNRYVSGDSSRRIHVQRSQPAASCRWTS